MYLAILMLRSRGRDIVSRDGNSRSLSTCGSCIKLESALRGGAGAGKKQGSSIDLNFPALLSNYGRPALVSTAVQDLRRIPLVPTADRKEVGCPVMRRCSGDKK